MPTRTDEARALLQQYVHTLHGNVSYMTQGQVHHRPTDLDFSGFLPRQTWLVLPIRINASLAYTADVRAMRAFVEVVGRLSASADFGLRDFYHGFWKSALFDKVKRVTMAATEYDDPRQLLAVEIAQAPRFLLDLSLKTVTSAHVQLLRRFFFADVAEALSEVNDALLSRLTAGHIPGTMTRRAPVVEIGLGSNSAIDAAVLGELCQLIKDVQQLQQQPDTSRVQLDFSTLWMENLQLNNSSDLALVTDAVANSNSRIRHLKLTKFAVETEKRSDGMKAAFQSFSRAILLDKGRADPSKALRSLLIPRALISHHDFVDLCSALRYASNLRELSVQSIFNRLEVPMQDRDFHLGWAWLAFVILHPDSAIRLDRLDVSKFPIEAKNMKLVAEIITCVRPGRRLWELQHGPLPTSDDYPEFEEIDLPADQRFFVTLALSDDNAKIWSRPASNAPVLFVIVDATEHFEVLVLLSGWVCVLVPGYGCGWAPSAAITSQRTQPTKCVAMSSTVSSNASPGSSWPLAGANVKHLVLSETSAMVYDVTPAKHLLQMVGHSLVGLDSGVNAIKDSDVGEILDACPNLTHLSLGGAQLNNISALLERYRSGQCKITYLNVTSDEPNNRILAQLVEWLAEPSGKALLHLCAGGMGEHGDPVDRLEKQWQENMLAHNRIHRVGSVTVAFLSVIATHRPSSLGSLDAKMLSHVLDFAGISMERTGHS